MNNSVRIEWGKSDFSYETDIAERTPIGRDIVQTGFCALEGSEKIGDVLYLETY